MYRPLHWLPSASIKIERIRNDVLTMEVAAFSKRQIPYRHRLVLGQGLRWRPLSYQAKPWDVASWHFSEVVIPMRDVHSWGKTGSGQRWGEPTRMTHSRRPAVL